MMKLFSFIQNKIHTGSARTVVIKQNIIGSFIIKGGSIITSLLIVPVTLKLLNPEKYGIWITLFSIVTWFNMMDIGLGNGFRNKFAEAIALKKNQNAKKYVETIFGATLIIALVFFILFSIVQPFLNWHKILNLPNTFDEDISKIVWIVFGLFSLQLVLKNISTVFLALQKTAFSNLIIFLGNLLALTSIIILGKLDLANLQSISLAFMISPIFTFTLANIILFSGKLRMYMPTHFHINKKYFKNMMNLGLKFFFIQITTIVMFTSGNFIITQLFGPEEVTPYSISFRLFSATISIFAIIITPFWSAYTEAITKNDFKWIRFALKKLKTIWVLFAVCIIILLFVSPIIFHYWVGDGVKIPLTLSASFALYAVLLSWSGMFSQFLNGVGKIKIQMYIAIFQCLSNIPLAIFLAKYLNFGVTGIIMATNLNLLISAIILPIQVSKISNRKDIKLWSK